MDALTLSRIQFGSTIIYHYLFIPLTIGLGLIMAIMETLYVLSGNEDYKKMTQFWSKLFIINFTLGVVTGIVQEFQFGMNWSVYSKFVGDVFGAPLAIETLLAFFLESTFLGIWIFGWGQLSKKVHLAANWLTCLGSILSAFWIIVANAFMQEPVGYAIRNGHAEMTNFFAMLTNETLWVMFPHVLFGAIVTGAFFVIGISAYQILIKGDNKAIFERSLRIGLIMAVIGGIGVFIAGDLLGKVAVATQPMKMSAAEALWQTESPASWTAIALPDPAHMRDVFAIKIPYLLSFLSNDSFTSTVEGIQQLQAQAIHQYGPGNYIPPVALLFFSFRIMIGVGSLLPVLALAGLFLMHKKRLEQMRWFLWVLVASLFLPYLANTFGWVLTEMGRQPWLVYGVLKTSAGVSSLSPGLVLFSLIVFILLYGILAVIDGVLLFRVARRGIPEEVKETESQKAAEEELVISY